MRSLIDLVLSDFILPIVLNALLGFEDIREFKILLLLRDISRTLFLDNLRAWECRYLTWVVELEGLSLTRVLANLKFLLISASSKDFGGFLGGGGIGKDLLEVVACKSNKLFEAVKRDSNRAMDGEGSQSLRIWEMAGISESAYLVIPSLVHLILNVGNSTLGAVDSGVGGLGGIVIENLAVITSCLLSYRGFFRGHI